MKKIDRAVQFLTENAHLFQCPVCQAAFDAPEGYSLVCTNRHAFDVAKKGTLYFLTKGAKNEYDREMLSARYKIAEEGLFYPILDEVYSLIQENSNGNVLDVGCGEGSQLAYLTKKGLTGQKIGFDISKDAIQLAATHFTEAFWCVADLARSPFASNQYDTLLNIFSPSNYQEFNRLLKPGGKVIKVVPEKDYLSELRALLYRDEEEKQSYSNEAVMEKFKEHFPDMEVREIRYAYPLNEERFENLLHMTPLSWSASEEAKQFALAHRPQNMTVNVKILIGTNEA